MTSANQRASRTLRVRHAAALTAAILAGLGTTWPLAAVAQYREAPQIASEREVVADPPGRAGRLAEVSGSVWLFHPEVGDWMAAARNRPLTSGDRLSVDPGGRVEVRIGSTSLRLDGGTELELVHLDDDRLDLDLRGGSMAVRVRSPEAARGVTVATDAGRVTLQRTGRYRFDQHSGLSQVTVWSGQALYEGPESALTVSNGQRADFWIDANRRAQYRLGDQQRDNFATWVADSDRADDRAVAPRYVSPEMTGAEDLDRYGRWEQHPEYGALWTPREVAVDWAPYAAGQWAWVSPWGWTWVDAAPWGFAPFHYGRWVSVRNRWSWAPGRYEPRPVFAPALVGWVGGGRGSVSVSIGGGPGVGWFPLAPREAYLPGYLVSPRYVRTVNGPHFHNGDDIDRLIQSPVAVLRGIDYRNRKFIHGTSAAPVDAFQRRGAFAVSPQWRASPEARDFERMPASPVAMVAPPPWLKGREVGRDAGRDAVRDGSRDSRRDAWQDGRSDGRRDGRSDFRSDLRSDGRGEARTDNRGRGDAEASGRRDTAPGRPPAVAGGTAAAGPGAGAVGAIAAPGMVGIPSAGPRDRPDDGRGHRQPPPGTDPRGSAAMPQPQPQPQPHVATAPPAAVFQTQPPGRAEPPDGTRPVNTHRPDRGDTWNERGDRPDRGERGERRDRVERSVPPPAQAEAPRKATPPPPPTVTAAPSPPPVHPAPMPQATPPAARPQPQSQTQPQPQPQPQVTVSPQINRPEPPVRPQGPPEGRGAQRDPRFESGKPQ